MKLREAKTFGMFDDHQRRVRHVDADLDDGSRNQDIQLTRDNELLHDRSFVGGFHLAVQQTDA